MIETLPDKIQGRIKEVIVTEMTIALLLAIKKTNGYSLNAHSELGRILKYLPEKLHRDATKEFNKLKAAGLVRKHRNNTFSWTVEGRDAAKAASSSCRGINHQKKYDKDEGYIGCAVLKFNHLQSHFLILLTKDMQGILMSPAIFSY